MEPVYFASPAEFRAWLKKNHATATEILVGYHKVSTGKPSMTWAESVDEALCYGWIDGIRRRVDDERYTIRFTPRRPKSRWSAVNVKRVPELMAEGRMQPAGLAAFERRGPSNAHGYSYEQRKVGAFSAAQEKRFRANKKAWAFFIAQPPGYRQTITFWVISAKRAETQDRRLNELIAASADGRRVL